MSDKDKKTEEIKALLRKKLEGAPPAEDGWNVPSPGVWSGLSEELGHVAQRKPRNTWMAKLATIIAALLVVLFWRECSNQRQLTGLRTEIEGISAAYGQLQEACEESQAAIENKAAIAPNELQGSERNEAAIANATTRNSSGSDDHFPIKKAASKTPTHTAATATSTKANPISTEKMAAGAMATTPIFDATNQATMKILAQNEPTLRPLPFPVLSTFLLVKTGPKTNLHLPNPKDQGASVKLIASMHGGLALTGNTLSGEKPAIITDQRPLTTWRAGLGLEAAVNRQWSVLTGLDYNHSRIETDYQLAVPYTHNGEFQHDDGNFDNQYNHSLPSALGDYPAQFVLTRANNAQVEEGEVMNLELYIRQQTRFVSLPLQLRYGFGKHRWQAGAKAGIYANHVLGISSENPELVSHHGAIHERQTTIGTPPLNDLEKWTLDYTLGMDLRYQFWPRFALSMSTGYQRGITPVYKSENVKNYLHAWNLGAGVQYWFR